MNTLLLGVAGLLLALMSEGLARAASTQGNFETIPMWRKSRNLMAVVGSVLLLTGLLNGLLP